LTGFQHNDIVVSMIPAIDPSTGYLPAGVHSAAWADIAPCFGGNSHRAYLVAGLHMALANLAGAGCSTVFLDGSFVSEKDFPNDYDGAWEPHGVNPALIDPILLDFTNARAAMKLKYGGELFPASIYAATGVLYRHYFQQDRNGVVKGILQIDLGSLP
jgi:hypothetical protein